MLILGLHDVQRAGQMEARQGMPKASRAEAMLRLDRRNNTSPLGGLLSIGHAGILPCMKKV